MLILQHVWGNDIVYRWIGNFLLARTLPVKAFLAGSRFGLGLRDNGCPGFLRSLGIQGTRHRGSHMKILIAMVASLGMLSAAAAADMPRKEPPPPVAPVGKAPIGKLPIGKAPIGKYPVGKYPTPVVTKG